MKIHQYCRTRYQGFVIPVWKPCSYILRQWRDEGDKEKTNVWWEDAQILLFLLLPHVQKKRENPFASTFVKHGFILDGCLGWGGVCSELCATSNLFKGEIGQQRLDETSYRTSRNSWWAWNSFGPRNSLKQTSTKSKHSVMYHYSVLFRSRFEHSFLRLFIYPIDIQILNRG